MKEINFIQKLIKKVIWIFTKLKILETMKMFLTMKLKLQNIPKILTIEINNLH